MLITRLAIKWKASVFLLMFVITVFGAIAYVSLPKESSPDVKIPLVLIMSTYEGVSPTDIESLITLPIERNLKGINGVKEIKSYSSEGVSNIMVEFMTGEDISVALQRVKDKVDQAKRDLPTDMQSDPLVFEISTSDFPVMVVAISGEFPEAYLKKIADDLKDEFEGVRGVLEVNLSGARDREIVVEFDYERLQAYNLSFMELASAVQKENLNIPGGAMDIGKGKYLLRIPGEFTEPSLIDTIVLTTKNGLPIYLKDVATVIDTFEDKDSYARLNKVSTISLSIKKRSGENIIYMAQTIKMILVEAEKMLPPAVKITMITDESEMIEEMVHELENHLATGLFLVVLVLFLFLGTTNSIFTAMAIPFSMLMSFIVFQYLGITINMVLLFALIMALGMLVDDAIVIVENIYRHMQEGLSRSEAANAASAEVGWPIVASTLTKVFAFLPLMFWPGVFGEFMKYIPLTMIVTLTSSLFVALVFNPVICSSFMRVKKVKLNEEGELELGRAMKFYKKAIHLALDHRALTLIITIIFMFTPFFLYPMFNLGMEFFPESDPKRIYIRANSPQGTSAFTTLQNMFVLENATDNEPDVEKVLSEVGGSAASFADSGGTVTHLGKLTIEFVPFAEREESSVIVTNRIREKIGALPGSEVFIEKETMGPPGGSAVSIELSGANVAVLGDIAAKIKPAIQGVPGLVDLKDDYVKSKPEVRIIVDREKAALLGLSTSAIGSTVRGAVAGYKVGVYREGDEEYDVKVRLPIEKRKSIDDIKNMRIPNQAGQYIPLSSVADVELAAGFGTITRIDFKRVVNITANAEGRSGMEVLADVKKILADFEVPSGYKMRYTGEDEDQQEASSFLSKAFAVAIFLILMVLLVEFNSISQTMIILGTVLLSIGGVFWGLIITQTPFGIIMTGIGVISLAGVVVNNGIIMIDYTNKLIEQGYPMREAVSHAGVVRFRPVMLTAITAILGMLPMATGYGINFRNMAIEKGAEMSQWWGAMANAVIFGLTFATMLTLLVVPVLYSFTGKGLYDGKRERKGLRAKFKALVVQLGQKMHGKRV